jgi:tetratricopeptide (TPR) repeat protein
VAGEVGAAVAPEDRLHSSDCLPDASSAVGYSDGGPAGTGQGRNRSCNGEEKVTSDPAALARARSAYQSGRLTEAARLCRQALQADPRNAEAWCLLGIAQRASSQPAQAADSYRQALRLRPDFVEAWNNLGNALVTQGKLDEAAAAFEQVLRLRPDYAEAHNNLGVVLRHQGKWAEAAARYQQALRLKPDYPDALNNLGDALQGLGRLEEAAASYRRALHLRPNYPEAHTNLGNALNRLERPDEAAAHHREALRLRPGYAEAHSNLGNTLVTQRKYAEAEACYREALRLRPDWDEAHHNLGTALAEQGRLAEAEACYREALRLRPDHIDACGNLATALMGQGKAAEAAAVYQRVLEFKPDSPDAHLSRAMACLALGFWEEGWAEYEWRWRCPDFGTMPYTQPLWDGSPLAGRTILLHAEQGLGDTMLAVRYAPKVKERGGTVLLACPRALGRLLAGFPGVDRVIEQGADLPAFDCHAPLMGLPGIFRTTPETVPAEIPYLFADPALVEHWRREIAGRDFRVGIAWQGNPRFKADRQRSIPLARFAPLAAVPGVRLFSLQKGAGSEQVRDASFPVVDLGPRLDEAAGAFMDTAAVMKNLDLVISPDTAVTHLAGALGVPAWVALPYSAHWLWLMEREDTPWYPTLRLFRQRTWGNWEEVFERMAAALAQRAEAPRAAGPVLVEVAPGELIDKIAILQIKSERISNEAKRRNVRRELAVLAAARDRALPASEELTRLAGELKAVNEALWEVEDEVRRCEQAADFGPRFVELARSVYRHNDRRAALKRQVNDLLGSSLKEEKSYTTEP